MQLGKLGLTENFILTLKKHFEKHKNIRISVLKSARDPAHCNSQGSPHSRNHSAGQDKEKIKEYSNEILEKLGKNYTSKLIGFKIILKKWRKEKR